jgi:hypothetical protein
MWLRNEKSIKIAYAWRSAIHQVAIMGLKSGTRENHSESCDNSPGRVTITTMGTD